MIKDPNTIENLLIYGIDLKHRRIYFGNAADTDGTNDFKESNIDIILRAIDKMLDFSNSPIELHFSSYGGDPYAMLALKDRILEAPCQFKFYGRGYIMSAATWIMAVCDERYLAQDTIVMLHDGSEGFEGKHSDIEVYTAHSVGLQDRLNELFAENSYLPKAAWAKLVRRDLYLTADEAKALGLVDEVLQHRKRGNLRKGPRAKTFANVPSKSRLESVLKKLARRIHMEELTDIKVEVPQEKFETIESYDNTAAEITSSEPTQGNEK